MAQYHPSTFLLVARDGRYRSHPAEGSTIRPVV
jgi:hypothetical protein